MVKHLDHLNLSVSDLADTEAFYGGLFGFQRVEEGVSDGVPWRILRAGEAMLCLYEHPDYTFVEHGSGTGPRHGLNHMGLRITDPEAFLARAQEMSVEIRYGGEVSWPHSRAWYVADPTGYEIEVVAWKDDTVRFDAA